LTAVTDEPRDDALHAHSAVKLAFHDANTDTDTDILAMILADTFDTRDRFPEVIPVAS